MSKSLAFGALHVGIAFSVGFALTGSVAIAGAITLVEPLVNTVAHYFFDRWWGPADAPPPWRRRVVDLASADGHAPLRTGRAT